MEISQKSLDRLLDALIAVGCVVAIGCAARLPAAVAGAEESIRQAERAAAWARESIVQRGVLPVMTLPEELALVEQTVQAESVELGGEETEDAHTDEVLVEQGFFREDVPLSFDIQAAVHGACEASGVPYALALGLIEVESGFRADAVNGGSGCYGLCQLHPRYFPAGLSPEENIWAGIGWLGELLAKHGDTAAALTAYHVGHDDGSRGYAAAVMEAAGRWEDAKG